jgi:hypothetical protein
MKPRLSSDWTALASGRPQTGGCDSLDARQDERPVPGEVTSSGITCEVDPWSGRSEELGNAMREIDIPTARLTGHSFHGAGDDRSSSVQSRIRLRLCRAVRPRCRVRRRVGHVFLQGKANCGKEKLHEWWKWLTIVPRTASDARDSRVATCVAQPAEKLRSGSKRRVNPGGSNARARGMVRAWMLFARSQQSPARTLGLNRQAIDSSLGAYGKGPKEALAGSFQSEDDVRGAGKSDKSWEG